MYENKTLFKGTGDDIKRFVDKIEDINKNSGSKASKKYLDELDELAKKSEIIKLQEKRTIRIL